MKKTIFYTSLTALVIFSAGCGDQAEKMKKMQKPIPEAELIQPKEEVVEIKTQIPARAEAVQIVEIKPRVDGFLEKVYKKDFESVKEGEVLYKIESTQLENTIESNKAEVFKTKTAFQSALSNLERHQELYKTKAISKGELEIARNTYAQAKASYMTAEATLKTNQLNLSYSTIKAPISGVLADHKFDAGSYINQSSGAINKIYDTSIMYLFASIPSEIYGKMKLSDFYVNGKSVSLQHCSPTVNESSKMFVCSFILENNKDLINNQEVSIDAKYEESALIIPQKTITQNKASKAVFVVQEGKAKYKNIEVGDWVGEGVVVKSGLTKDDKIIKDIAKIKNDGEVKIKE